MVAVSKQVAKMIAQCNPIPATCRLANGEIPLRNTLHEPLSSETQLIVNRITLQTAFFLFVGATGEGKRGTRIITRLRILAQNLVFGGLRKLIPTWGPSRLNWLILICTPTHPCDNTLWTRHYTAACVGETQRTVDCANRHTSIGHQSLADGRTEADWNHLSKTWNNLNFSLNLHNKWIKLQLYN